MIVGSLDAWRQVTEVTLVLDGASAQACGLWSSSRVEKFEMASVSRGAKARTISGQLRGAKGPLFHGGSSI
jgi:hypothetical protein